METNQYLHQIEGLLNSAEEILQKDVLDEIDQRYVLRRLRKAKGLLDAVLTVPEFSEPPKRSTVFGISDGESFRSFGFLHLWPNGTVTWSDVADAD